MFRVSPPPCTVVLKLYNTGNEWLNVLIRTNNRTNCNKKSIFNWCTKHTSHFNHLYFRFFYSPNISKSNIFANRWMVWIICKNDSANIHISSDVFDVSSHTGYIQIRLLKSNDKQSSIICKELLPLVLGLFAIRFKRRMNCTYINIGNMTQYNKSPFYPCSIFDNSYFDDVKKNGAAPLVCVHFCIEVARFRPDFSSDVKVTLHNKPGKADKISLCFCYDTIYRHFTSFVWTFSTTTNCTQLWIHK